MKEAKDPVVTLKATAKEFNFSKLRADQDNKLANSGETMFLDFQRMNFIINGKEIDKNLLITLKEGAQDYESELFSKKDDIYNPESEKKREIDTDQGRAFVDSVLKELNQNRLPEIWENHCNNPDIADHQKTDTYKKEFERFYNVGKEHNYLLLKKGEKNYRPFVKEVFKEMFKYAEAEVPSDAILEELVTNCNQAGYGAGIFNESHAALSSCNLTPHSPKKALNIYCTDHNRIKVTSDMAMPITTIDNPEEKICDLSSSLEFTLESQDGKDSIIYKEGKLLLTIPKELKDYKSGGKNLFDIIKEHFQTFFERLGFKFETKMQIEHDLGTQIKVSNYLDGMISTARSDANKEFISLLEKNLKDELSKLDDNKEDIDAYVEVKVPTVNDLLSNYAKLEDNKENRELLIKEVADNLGLSSRNYDNSNSFALRFLPSLVKGQVNYEQAQVVANIFTKLIIEGKSEVYEKQGAINAIDAINRKIDGKIIEQEEKATNKQDIENDKWTDKIKKQRLSMESPHLF